MSFSSAFSQFLQQQNSPTATFASSSSSPLSKSQSPFSSHITAKTVAVVEHLDAQFLYENSDIFSEIALFLTVSDLYHLALVNQYFADCLLGGSEDDEDYDNEQNDDCFAWVWKFHFDCIWKRQRAQFSISDSEKYFSLLRRSESDHHDRALSWRQCVQSILCNKFVAFKPIDESSSNYVNGHAVRSGSWGASSMSPPAAFSPTFSQSPPPSLHVSSSSSSLMGASSPPISSSSSGWLMRSHNSPQQLSFLRQNQSSSLTNTTSTTTMTTTTSLANVHTNANHATSSEVATNDENERTAVERRVVHQSTMNLMDTRDLKQLEFDQALALYHHQLIRYEIGGRCVMNSNHDRGTKWITVPLAYAMKPGYLYQWSILVDHMEAQGSNYWKIIVGAIPHPSSSGLDDHSVSERQRMRRRANGVWIGSEGVEGIGLILASNRIMYKLNDFFKLGSGFQIKDGDVVTIQFDMTHSSEENDELLHEKDISVATKDYVEERKRLIGRKRVGASIMFFLNGEPIMEEPFDYISGQHFYPAVSLINRQKISLLNIARFKL